jgi:DNA-binding protein HU-beta
VVIRRSNQINNGAGAEDEPIALIEKVARQTELNQAVAGEAVKAVVKAILDSLVAGEPIRVSGLGTFNVASRPARQGRNPQSGETIKIAASKAVRFHAGKAAREARPDLVERQPNRGLRQSDRRRFCRAPARECRNRDMFSG